MSRAANCALRVKITQPWRRIGTSCPGCCAACPDPSLEDFLADENSAALTADEVAVGDELLVRGDHCIARNLQLLREFAA